MSRVLTFSRVYPSYHPKKGQSTYFVEKVLKSLKIGYDYCVHEHSTHSFWSLNRGKEKLVDDFIKFNFSDPFDYKPKYHTMRAGHLWKAGDWFSPRVWSGKPYNSKQIQFAPDIQVKKVWDFKNDGCDFYLNGELVAYASSPSELFLTDLAKNDGLSEDDLLAWFQYPKEFDGQIICWNENINY